MIEKDFQFIEDRLGILLPTVFKKFVGRFPNDATTYLKSEHGTIQLNAELFVINELERVNNASDSDYYEQTPHLRDHRFVEIGDDGCGNFYCMQGNSPKSNKLWLWEHDPYNGFRLVTGYPCSSLSAYFNLAWSLATQPDPFSPPAQSARVVSRANHPRRSALTPISISEWNAFRDAHTELAVAEMFDATNPFNGETIQMRRWPGRAKLLLGGAEIYIQWQSGGLVMVSDESITPEQREYMRVLAVEFNANVF